MSENTPKPDTPSRAGGAQRGRRSGPRKPKAPKMPVDFDAGAALEGAAADAPAPNPDAPPVYLADLKALQDRKSVV